ncbi:hypothetical protein NL676_031755 [Syzygium grande]|nr:hypothetical protein NL676_031755 [Syzygium grande]
MGGEEPEEDDEKKLEGFLSSTSSFGHRGVFLVVEEGGRHVAEALRGNSTWRISIRWHGHADVWWPHLRQRASPNDRGKKPNL